ncbi:hypothetical protein RRG08_025161 [Elysia crispata]|uniref:Uncharacterized protein n=1 Tax=Elysia crispata TaxID=231223 RepID=A0AAE0YB64_9GAST|nr:hypothetical protein RRG08_025161 [Elysia crispata]
MPIKSEIIIGRGVSTGQVSQPENGASCFTPTVLLHGGGELIRITATTELNGRFYSTRRLVLSRLATVRIMRSRAKFAWGKQDLLGSILLVAEHSHVV